MDETPPSLELSDIPNVEPMIPSPALSWWVWVVIAVLSIALVFVLVKAVKSRTTSQTTLRQRAYLEAMASLEQARLMAIPVALATHVSLAIRHYLATVFGDPSLFQTHEEFLSRHQALAVLPEATRQRLEQNFNDLARLKYAPMETPKDLSGLVPQMIQLLEHLHAVHPVTSTR